MSASSKKKLRKEQNAAQLTEKQLNEQKEAKKLRTQTIVFVVAVALVLAIGLASLAVSAYKTSGITERLTTALTIGDHKLSTAELNYFYIDAINSTYNNWYNQYGEYTATYLSYLYGLDLTKSLDEQVYNKETNQSFADYFVDMAVQNAVSTYALCDLAAAENYQLSDVDKAAIENTMKNLESTSKSSGYQSVNAYLKAFYGNGASARSFRDYLELASIASAVENEHYTGFTYTADDLAAHSEENFDKYSSFSYSTFYLDVDDFVICTAEEDDKGHKHSQEEMNHALNAAREAANSILAAEPMNADDFNAAIKKLSVYVEDDSAVCTENDDLLYTSITDADISAWLADGSRKTGDMTVIADTAKTTDEDGNTDTETYGFTLVLFQSRNDNEMKLTNVRHILKSFTGATTDDKGNTVYPPSSIEESKQLITNLQKSWLDNGGTEEGFAELAKLNSTDGGSAANGGLYENIYPGQMVPAFNDWCFDEARQPGDYEIVETEYGYHLMYFVGHSAVTFRDYMIENDLRNADYDKWYQGQIDAVKYTVNNTSHLERDLVLAGY